MYFDLIDVWNAELLVTITRAHPCDVLSGREAQQQLPVRLGGHTVVCSTGNVLSCEPLQGSSTWA